MLYSTRALPEPQSSKNSALDQSSEIYGKAWNYWNLVLRKDYEKYERLNILIQIVKENKYFENT